MPTLGDFFNGVARRVFGGVTGHPARNRAERRAQKKARKRNR